MSEKLYTILGLSALFGVCVAYNAAAVDYIRSEDEALLSDVIAVDVKPTTEVRENVEAVVEKTVEPLVDEAKKAETFEVHGVKRFDKRKADELKAVEDERKQWFSVETSPTFEVKQEEKAKQDPAFEEFRQSISRCLDSVEEQLSIEREMFERTKDKKELAYLSNTLAEINECYEMIGEDIIEYYYENDLLVLDKFTKKAKEFVVSASGLNFDAKKCSGYCTMDDVIEAQINKFAEYRLYLTELLEKRPEVQ